MADGLVTIAVELQDGSVVKGVANLQGLLGEAGGSFTKMGAIAGVAGAVASKGIDFIVSSVKDMWNALSESSATWKTFEGNMQMFGNSKSQITGVKKELQQFAQQTIYSSSDMASTYAQLAAVGTKNTTQLVKGFGGLAAAAEDPQQAMKTLSQQATQMAAKPQVAWEDFKLVLEQTPAGVAAIAKTMGVSTQELIKNVQDGNVATQDFFDAIAKTGTNADFTKLATQYKTVGQAMDGLTETLTNKLQPAFDLVSGYAIQAISALTDEIGDVNFQPLVDGINGTVNAIQKIVQFISDNKDWIAPLAVGLAAGAAAFVAFTAVTAAIGPVASAIATLNNLHNTVGILRFGLMNVQGAASSLWGVIAANPIMIAVVAIAALAAGLTYFFTQTETGRKAWQSFMTWFKGAWESLQPVVATVMNFINNTLQRVANAIQPLVRSFKNWATSMTPVSGAFSSLQGPMSTVTGLLLKFGPMVISLIAPIGLVGKLLLQFAAAFAMTGSAGGAVTQMVNNFSNMTTTIINGLTAVINGITAVMPQIIQTGVKIITSLIQGIVSALPQIITAITTGINLLVSAITTLLPMLINVGITVLNAVIDGLITALPLIVQAGVTLINGLVSAVTTALPLLIGAALLIMTTLLQGLINLLPVLISAGLEIVSALFSALIDNLPMIIEAAIELLMALINGLISVLPQLIQAGITIVMTLMEALIDNLPKIIDAGIQLLMALINGLIQILPQLVNAGIQLITALFQAFIRMTPQILSAGIQLIQALIRGVGQLLGSLMQAGGQLIGGMLSAILGYLGQLLSAGGQLVSSLISGIGSRIGGVASSVSNGISSAVSAVTGFVGSMTSAAGNLVDGLINGITGKISGVVNAAKKMAKSAVDAAKDFLNIHSPSRVMRDEVGKFIPEGLAVGIDRYANVAVDSMNELSSKLTNIKPEPQISWGTAGGMNAASAIIQHQVVGNGTAVQPQAGNTAYIEMNTTVQANPSEAEQARQLKNTMRQMGYDATW